MGINLDTKNIRGLSESEAENNIKRFGPNEMPSSDKRSFIRILLEVIKEPMFILLIACGTIYFFLGDIEEAFLLMGFVIVVICITLYQENKTERALDALKDLSSPRALVIRDGEQKRIAGKDVAKYDIVVLSEGDRVPADAAIVSCSNLCVDESLLTGESIPVRKSELGEGILSKDSLSDSGEMRPGGDDIPYVYSGTLIVSGVGIAKVFATGMNTEMGKIGKSLNELKDEKTKLQEETDSIVKKCAFFGLVICLIVVIVYGLTRGDFIQGILAGITLAMSILPEEFPVVLTIFLALGAWRMSQKNVLARRQHAIQALGSTTVLCTDKTGTLTLNKMTLKKIFSGGKFLDLSANSTVDEGFHELIEFGILASQKEPFDPMEKALKEILDKHLKNTEHDHHDWELVQEYPLSKDLLAVSQVWKSPKGSDYVVAAKGAPEAIWDLCHLGKSEVASLNERVLKMADEGFRVLGVAKATMKKMPKSNLPDKQHDFEFEFLGLLGFEDPVRPGVADAVRECHEAGIRVVMITGDYPGTARNIGLQIGLLEKDKKDHSDEIITGPELNNMSDHELARKISNIKIFARAVPEQKLKIVNALKENGDIVAMTGDGVNDAPALKSAHIGVAMGARGTDVAREASGVVLLDDDFSSIVHGVSMGRRIFDNIRKAMSYVLAVHIPIAGVTLLAVLLKWPMILLPAHILFLELVIDPACSVVFEAEKEEKNIMKRKPRDPKEKIFDRKTFLLSLLQGLVALAMVVAVFMITFNMSHNENEARAFAFTTLIISNLCLILANRSWDSTIFSTLKVKNSALWMVITGALVFLALSLYVPFLQGIFKFGILHPVDVLICVGAAFTSIAWFEILKIIWKLKKKSSSKD